MSGIGDKVCVICGQECSGVPRIKDKHGRYACRSCAEAKRSKRSASPPRPHPRPEAALRNAPAGDIIPLAVDAPMLDDLPAAPAPTGAPCPGCGMPTKAGAVICLGCGFNLETGSELATKVKERRVREPIGKPSSVRLAAGAGASCAGAAVGLGLWATLEAATGRPWYSMAALVGVLAGVGMLLAVRGAGRMTTGWIATGPGVVAAGIGLTMFAPEPTEPFPNPFISVFSGGGSLSMVQVMGDDEAAMAGSVWIGLAGLSAFAFGRSNPDEDAETDEPADGTTGSGA